MTNDEEQTGATVDPANELEHVRKEYNVAVANGHLGRARALDRLYRHLEQQRSGHGPTQSKEVKHESDPTFQAVVNRFAATPVGPGKMGPLTVELRWGEIPPWMEQAGWEYPALTGTIHGFGALREDDLPNSAIGATPIYRQLPRPSESRPSVSYGHGHVFPRSDGVKARCGGPPICAQCAWEALAFRSWPNDPKER